MTHSQQFVLACSLLIFPACSGDDDGGRRDVGSDGAVDAPSDAAVDVPSDAAVDVAADVTADAGIVGCSPTLSSTYTPTSQPYSLFVVHLEPGVEIRSPGPDVSDVFVEGLIPLVARADELQIPLTIFMHQVWVDYIIDNELQGVVRSWLDPTRAGPVHEIGIHNHGPAHTQARQSGYSNWDAQRADDVNQFYLDRGANEFAYLDRYEGTISDVATAIGELVGIPITSGSTMQSWHESPAQVVYEQVGRGTGRNARFARMTHWDPVTGYRDAYLFNASPLGTTTSSVMGAWRRYTEPPMVSEQTWGSTIHAHNFREVTHRAIVEEYLCAIASVDPGNTQNKRRTVRDLMENVAIPAGHVFEGFCGDGYCDSREAGPDPTTANPFPIPTWGTGESTSTCIDCLDIRPGGTGDGNVIEAAGAFP